MQPCIEAYLDIETTELSPTYDEITVVGIHLCSETDAKFIQLVGRDVTAGDAQCFIVAMTLLEGLVSISRSVWEMHSLPRKGKNGGIIGSP